MNVIKHLQENTPETSVKNQSVQISLKKALTPPESPKPPTPPTVPPRIFKQPTTDPPSVRPRSLERQTPDSSHSINDIQPQTEVYAIWSNDDSLVYKVDSPI